tara:strand:+ start:1208 stop:1648 length:441 start_codon:yes stop_codon:yes gene_type:complete
MIKPGLHKYDAIEAGGYDKGDVGFLILSCASTIGSSLEFDFTSSTWNTALSQTLPAKQWTDPSNQTEGRYGPIGMYVLNQVNAQWRSRAVGDDLSNNGSYQHTTLSSTNYSALVRGMFWGEFDKLSLWKPIGGTDYVKIIIGRWDN